MVVRTLLDPKIDFVFKKIFGAENNKSVLIDFLNAVINDKDPIVEVELKNTDMEKEFLDSKFSRLDIKAITDKKEHINIEIQVKNEYNMIQRTLYYWSRMYSEQIGNGENYSYYYTEKEKVNNYRTFRKEKKISDKLYLTYLSEIDNQLFTIIKTRYCFVYENQYFKLDVFNNDKKYGILEIEATDQNGKILLPDFLNITADVTKDSMYSNYEISKRNYVGK